MGNIFKTPIIINIEALIDNYHKRSLHSVASMNVDNNEGIAGDHQHRADDGEIFGRIFVFMCLISLIPLILWFISAVTELLFHKCTKIQEKPSLMDCVQILDNYLDRSVATDLADCGYDNPQNLFWIVDADDDEDANYGGVIENEEDVSIQMPPAHGKIQNNAKKTGHRLQTQPRDTNKSTKSFHAQETIQKADHMLHLHKKYCYSKFEENNQTKRYLRGNFILALVATIKLLTSCVMMTLGLFALDTNPLAVLAFTGVAWTALWFQGGIVDLSRNYMYHFVMLASDKCHPGNIVMLDGCMKEFGCVYQITPLYTVLLIKRSGGGDGRSEELLFLDEMNYNFFVYPMLTAYRWKKPTAAITKKVARSNKTATTTTTTTAVMNVQH